MVTALSRAITIVATMDRATTVKVATTKAGAAATKAAMALWIATLPTIATTADLTHAKITAARVAAMVHQTITMKVIRPDAATATAI